eukprot:3360155-Rhodomonas_salina.2
MSFVASGCCDDANDHDEAEEEEEGPRGAVFCAPSHPMPDRPLASTCRILPRVSTSAMPAISLASPHP